MRDTDPSSPGQCGWWSDSDERVRRGRPFWSDFLPYCLYCNWDDDREGAASTLVATTTEDGHRKAVAFLCVECASDAHIRSWFQLAVEARYPSAAIEDRSASQEPWDP